MNQIMMQQQYLKSQRGEKDISNQPSGNEEMFWAQVLKTQAQANQRPEITQRGQIADQIKRINKEILHNQQA